ncbi:hypothetical protein [Pseudomonas aeruginosa]|uniref:hypothetical protein n=1 Tax=Pseudomonas aeruginosa TaxID=287 RepID=UPI001E4824A0|nr:hypothetical protein [Pseudomonas aeruginosa]MCD2761373.1 hypothetical protein [Pseudomonas aeruginosa]HBP0991511.1 hypothetical protein [Pseudomonas aeruginosa]HBP1202106.1 hypothetical protein [Pseudomonas aeruginosa]
MSKPINLQALLRRLDEQAYDQLCAEAARLAEANERLRGELACMEACAEGWREEAMNLHEQLAQALGGQCGITQSGALVVVPVEQCA